MGLSSLKITVKQTFLMEARVIRYRLLTAYAELTSVRAAPRPLSAMDLSSGLFSGMPARCGRKSAVAH